MAYYVRSVTAGGNSWDVRTWSYAIYKCDTCGKESEFTINSGFQYRERPCKHCKSMGIEDHLNTMKEERKLILKQISDLNSKLMNIETEISEIEHKKEIKQEIEILTLQEK